MKVSVIDIARQIPDCALRGPPKPYRPQKDSPNKSIRPKNVPCLSGIPSSFQTFHAALSNAFETMLAPELPILLKHETESIRLPQKEAQDLINVDKLKHLSAYQMYKLNQKYYRELKSLQLLGQRNNTQRIIPSRISQSINVYDIYPQMEERKETKSGRKTVWSKCRNSKTIEASRLEHQEEHLEAQRLICGTSREKTASRLLRSVERKTVFNQSDYHHARNKSEAIKIKRSSRYTLE